MKSKRIYILVVILLALLLFMWFAFTEAMKVRI